MMANSKKMDVITNNLANVNTNAYKKDTVVFESFPNMLTQRLNDTKSQLNPTGNIGDMSLGNDVGEIYTFYNQGAALITGNTLDFSIQNASSENENGAAFFTIGDVDANGNIKEYYTRDGAFSLNSKRQLVTKDGYLVMGQNGAITLDNDNFSVQDDGTILDNGIQRYKLLIREFTDTTTLRKYGENLVERTAQTQEQPFTGTITQGYLEQSNVNIVKEMVDMITVTRSYEANQKILQAQDGTLEKAVNEVGIVR
jgi:flagellar basal-body rod protein FlgG